MFKMGVRTLELEMLRGPVRTWDCFWLNTPRDTLRFVVELRNLARGRLDRHAQVERMCQLTAHRCFFAARSRTSHSQPTNECVIASFLLLCIHFYSRR